MLNTNLLGHLNVHVIFGIIIIKVSSKSKVESDKPAVLINSLCVCVLI